MQFNLDRFIDAQQMSYHTALQEIKNGRKSTHWMWYIFPQIKGLGFSSASQYYGIENVKEAEAYLQNPVLGERLIEICDALSMLPCTNATIIFGNPDDLKLKSCLTLFASIQNAPPAFEQLLDKFFEGERDCRTLQLIKQ